MNTDTSLYRLKRDNTNPNRRNWFLISRETPDFNCAEIYPEGTPGIKGAKWAYTVLNHAVMPSEGGFPTRDSAFQAAIGAYEKVAYFKNRKQPPTVGHLMESNDYQRLTYDEDGSEAFTTSYCQWCDTDSVPVMLVTDHPDVGEVFIRHVCIRCGHLES